VTLIYLSIAWIIGIYLGSKYTFPLWIFASGIIPLLLIPFLSKQKKTLLLSSLCILIFLGGGRHYHSNIPKINEQCLQFYNDKGNVEIEGMIITEPELRDRSSVFTLSARTISVDATTRQISGSAIVYVSRYSEYHYGDIVKLIGKLEIPPQFDPATV